MTENLPPDSEIFLSGWGRYREVRSRVQRPEKIAALHELVRQPDGKGLLARGLGRSYGDAALLPGGRTILTERLNRMLAFDERTGILRCEAGVSFEEILDVFLPRGWFPPVTPGTRFVTVGGSISCDVHGKNHHRDGSLSRSVTGMQVLLASGEARECSPDRESDLFWATAGGLGLTGIIAEVSLQLRRVGSAYFNVYSERAPDLDRTLELFDRHESGHQYSAAWIDCLAPGKSLGRSIVLFGNHADAAELLPQQRSVPFLSPGNHRWTVPFDLPSGLVNRRTASAFNSLYYSNHPEHPVQSIRSYQEFLYPLDCVAHWNRLYGKRGFMQYQCVFAPEVSRQALAEVLHLCSDTGWGSPLAVLKRFGPQEGWLSFPMAGYTLALDVPAAPGLLPFLNRLDELVLRFGGRVYLAKDIRLQPEAFRAMYPCYDRWLAVKSKLDPENRFRSSLSERLGIAS